MAARTATRETTRTSGNVGRGYWIRVQRTGSDWTNEKGFFIGVNGNLPVEWFQTISQDDVVKATICTSAESRKWAHKRRYAETFERK